MVIYRLTTYNDPVQVLHTWLCHKAVEVGNDVKCKVNGKYYDVLTCVLDQGVSPLPAAERRRKERVAPPRCPTMNPLPGEKVILGTLTRINADCDSIDPGQ